MGILQNDTTGRRVTLGPDILLGRSRGCGVAVADPKISSRHAAFRHRAEAWAVRDLGSRNGTRVEGHRIPVGAWVPLAEGQSVEFADDRWRLIDAGPPVPTAVDPRGARHRALDGLLALPDVLDPLATVHRTASGRWVLEHGPQPRWVTDGDVVQLDDGAWVLELPPLSHGGGTDPTAGQRGQVRALATLDLMRFAVSRDQETITCALRFGDETLDLPQRRHHELLLHLARARQDDGSLPEAEQGWCYADDVCRALGIARARLDVEAYRARRQLLDLAVEGAPGVIERRGHTQQLRLGVVRVEVGPL